MTLLLYIALYAAIACFVFGCARRVRQYAPLPAHLRWELYPVPHEPPTRIQHGGSYFEESDWWTKPRPRYRAGELRVMIAEIFLLKSVRESNRRLWWSSQLFHLGFYLCFASCSVLIVLTGISFAAAPAWLEPVARIASGFGRAGLALTMLGALVLLLHRIRERELRDYTHPADYVHLAVIGAAAALLLAGGYSVSAPGALGLIRGAFLFDSGVHVPVLLAAGMLMALGLLAYVPYSQMAHFIGKYFAFHSVRWDDAPNRQDAFAGQISSSLALRPTWSAQHFGAAGSRSWAEIAAANPATGEARK